MIITINMCKKNTSHMGMHNIKKKASMLIKILLIFVGKNLPSILITTFGIKVDVV